MPSNNKIFVSIASYRDPELQFTIDTLLKNADEPDKVSIGLCQQHYPGQFIRFDNPAIRYVNYRCTDSQGACWARSKAMKLYRGEEYFLQLDSHIAMVEHWDTLIREQMAMARQMSPNKLLFGIYPVAYEIKDGVRTFKDPYAIKTIIKNNKPGELPAGHGAGVNKSPYPTPCPYINAGLMFGDGSFCVECPYDPEIYFSGEELLNTLKAFTHGYDLFNPVVHLGWHLYKVTGDPNAENWTVHWNKTDDEQRTVRWWDLNNRSRDKLGKILRGELPNELGKVRTIKDFERYTGYNLTTLEALPDEEKNMITTPSLLWEPYLPKINQGS